MHVLQGYSGLVKYASRLFLRQVSLLPDVSEEISLAGVFKQEVNFGLNLEIIVKFDDVWVPHFSVRLNLAL